MQPVNPPQKVVVKTSLVPNADRGVFATADIAEGEIIEISPVIVIKKDDPSITDQRSIVPHYVFTFDEYEGFALGYGSLYNHAYEPNALYEKNTELRAVIFRARYDIKAGDEITVTYNASDPSDKSTPMNFGVPPYSAE